MKLHLALSNQSRAAGNDAEVVVKLDGRVVHTARLASVAQHAWSESAVDLERGAHALEVTETATGATAQQRFDADGDRWAVILFEAPPARLMIHVANEQVGYM